MRYGDVTSYGSYDQRQTEEFFIKPVGDSSKHFSMGFVDDGEIRYNTSVDRLEGHIRGEWSPFMLLDDFSECGGDTDDVIGQFVGACLNQCEYFSTVKHSHSSGSSITTTYDLWNVICNEHGLNINERHNFAIQPVMNLTEFKTHMHQHYGSRGVWNRIIPVTKDRFSSDFGKFNVTTWKLEGSAAWTIGIIANRMDAFKLECVDGEPPPPPPPPPDPVVLDVTANVTNFNVYEEVVDQYPLWNRIDTLNIIVNIHENVNVSGSESAAALIIDEFPLGTNITVNNHGNIVGKAGDGGDGGGYTFDATQPSNVSLLTNLDVLAGGEGGLGIYARVATTINNYSTGTIAGGGGGGGGSDHVLSFDGQVVGGTGGGGGSIGGVGGVHGRGWENKEVIAFEGDMFPTTYDGLPGNDSEGVNPGGSQTTTIQWTLFDDQLTPINWIDQAPSIITGVGGAGGGPGQPGTSGYTPALPAMGVLLWTQHNLPQDQDTLTIGNDTFTFYHCPTDTNSCWDGSTRTRNKDLKCMYDNCPDAPTLESFINKTDQSDSFYLEYEALRHVDDHPVVELTQSEIDKNIKQGFLNITWDPTTDFSNVSEKIVIKLEGDDADMFEISANGTNWSNSLDWPHNSFTKTHTCLFYVRGKPINDMDDARVFYADLSVSAFGLKKYELIDCELKVKVPSPVLESVSWDTTHIPLTDNENFGYKIIHSTEGVTWDQARQLAEAEGSKLVNLDSQLKMNRFRDWYDTQSPGEAWIGLDATGTPTWTNQSPLDTTIKPTRWWTDDTNGLTAKVSLIGDELNDYPADHKLNYYITETLLPVLDFEWLDGTDEPSGVVRFKGRFIQNTGITVSSDTISIWSHDSTPVKSSSVVIPPASDNTIDSSVVFSFDNIAASSLSSSHQLTVSWDDPNAGIQQQVFTLLVHRINESVINIRIISEPHDYSYMFKNGPSDPKAFEIRGSYMYDNMDVAVDGSFEISIDQGNNWSDQYTITPEMNPQIVHARLKAGLQYTGSNSFTEYNSTMNVQSIRSNTKTSPLVGRVYDCVKKELTYTYDGINAWYDITFDDMLETGSIQFDMWGAGGGSGGRNETANIEGGRGSGGFYSEGQFTVQPGDTIRIQTGQGGQRGKNNSTDDTTQSGGWSGRWQGGHGGDYRSNDSAGGGGGGGASWIMKKANNSSNWELIGDAAGGAGGGGAFTPFDSITYRGTDGAVAYRSSSLIEEKLQGLHFNIQSAGYSYTNRNCYIQVRYMNNVLYSLNTGRSYQMVRLRRLATGEWIVIPNESGMNRYDVYGNTTHAEMLNSDLLASTTAHGEGWLEMILIGTNDEPQNNRGKFSETLKTHFGAKKIDNLESRSAYILAAWNDGTYIHENYKDQFNTDNTKWNAELTYRYGDSFTPSGRSGDGGLGGGGASTTIGGAAGRFMSQNWGANSGESQLLVTETKDLSNLLGTSDIVLPPSPGKPINHAGNYRWYASDNISAMPGIEGSDVFNRNGHSKENKTFIDADPYGRQTVIWRCENKDADWRKISGSHSYPSHISAGDGGWNKYIKNLDPDKHYMSLVYVRRPDSYTGGQFYHGCQWRSTMNMDGSVNGNPYFSNFSQSSFAEGVWYLSVGFIWSKNTTTSLDSSIGGCYNLQTGAKLRDYRDYRMLTTTQYHRTYQYYSGSRTFEDDTFLPTKLDWAHPGFFQIDEVPTLEELLRGDWAGIQGAFPTQLTPQNENGKPGQVKLYFDCCKIDSYCINTTRTVPEALIHPTISLIGDADIVFDQGGRDVNFTDPGVNITNGGPVGIRVHALHRNAGYVTNDPNTLTGLDVGEYEIFYCTVSSDGLTACTKRVLRIVDLVKPTITLTGDSVMVIPVDIGFTDPGATAVDALDGDITSNIIVTIIGPDGLTATVSDMEKNVGEFTITYTATDLAGNSAAVTRKVTMKDTTPPVITLNGDNSVIHEATQVYDDAGATAIDNIDGDISNNIVTTSNVDINTPGIYNVTYTAEDSSGNSTTVSRVVQVRDTVKPVITLTGNNPYYHFAGDVYVDPGYTASDTGYNVGGLNDSVTVTTDVNADLAGVYTSKYNVSDSSGNQADEQTRSVIVVPGMNITTQVNFIGFDSLSFQFSREATGITSNTRSECYSINGVKVSETDPGGRHGLDYAKVGQPIYIGSFDQNGKNEGDVFANWGEGLPVYLRGLISNTHINTSWPSDSSVSWYLEHPADVYYLRKDGWNEVANRGKTDGWFEVENWVDPEYGHTLSTYSIDADRPWRVYQNRFDPGVYQLDDYSAMWFFNPETPQITYRYELSTSDTATGFDTGVIQTKTFNKFQTEVIFENLQPYTFYSCRLTVEHNNI